jgi:hypothetical protein
LPQEWWIHIAQLDMTDFIKETIFNVSTDAGLSEILQANWWVIPAAIVLVVVIIVGGRWLLRKLPPKDWNFSFDADAHLDEDTGYVETETLKPPSERFFNSAMLEKIVLVSLVSIIFSKVLPDVKASNIELAAGVAFIIILNTFISHWLARRGRELAFSITQFVVMTAINFGLVLLYAFLLPNFDGSINLGNTLFFILLLTLIVTLFDHYYPVYRTRFLESSDSALGERVEST